MSKEATEYIDVSFTVVPAPKQGDSLKNEQQGVAASREGDRQYSTRDRLKTVRNIGISLAVYPGLPLAGWLAERQGLLPSGKSRVAGETMPPFLFPIGRKEWLQQHRAQIEALGTDDSVETEEGFTINHPAKSPFVEYAPLTEEPEFILVEGQRVKLASTNSDQFDDTGFTIQSLTSSDGSSDTILSTVKTGSKHDSKITPTITYAFYPYLIGRDTQRAEGDVVGFKNNETHMYYNIQQIQSELGNTQFAFTPLVRSEISTS